MIGLVARPGIANSVTIEDVALPGDGDVIVTTIEVGICGTDRELARGEYGVSPLGDDYLVLGHEVLGIVASPVAGFEIGEPVTCMVRRGCGRCVACEVGAVDACLTGDIAEHGMIGLHGFAAEQFRARASELVRVPPSLVGVGILIEPLSVCARALRHATYVAERQPHAESRALVIGAGALGILMAAALRLRGLEVIVASRSSEHDRKAAALEGLGCGYRSLADSTLAAVTAEQGTFDLVFDTSGSADRAVEAIGAVGINGVLCLLGIDGVERTLAIGSAEFGSQIVERNKTIIGSVNAALQDWAEAVRVLESIDDRWPGFLSRLIDLRVPPDRFREALEHQGIKAAVRFAEVPAP